MSYLEDIEQLERQIARDLASDTKNRATAAASLLRQAIDIVADLQGSAAMTRAAHHMDQAATALIEVLT